MLFVNKSRVIHETEGYLFYYRSGKCLFVPSKDASITTFMSDTIPKKGYLLEPVCGIDGLKFLAEKFDVNIVYMDNKQEFTLPDSIYITTTKFRYLLNRHPSTDFTDVVEFEYKGKRYRINASDSFYGEVLKITGNAM